MNIDKNMFDIVYDDKSKKLIFTPNSEENLEKFRSEIVPDLDLDYTMNEKDEEPTELYYYYLVGYFFVRFKNSRWNAGVNDKNIHNYLLDMFADEIEEHKPEINYDDDEDNDEDEEDNEYEQDVFDAYQEKYDMDH